MSPFKNSYNFALAGKMHQESCLTCKNRKKKCSREHPICANCKRLGRNCAWIDDNMTLQQIKELKERVQRDEKTYKLKRKVEVQSKKLVNENAVGEKKRKKSGTTGTEFVEDVGLSINGSGTFNVLQFGKKEPNISSIEEPQKVLPAPEKTDSPEDLFDMIDNRIVPYNAKQSESRQPSFSFFEDASITQLLKSPSMRYSTEENKELVRYNSAHDCLIRPLSPLFEPLDEFYAPLNNENFRLSPSIPRLITSIPELNDQDRRYYDYYKNYLSVIVSIAPAESNFYSTLFLPLATTNPGVLNAILSWASTHMGNEEESLRYRDKSVKYIESNPIRSDDDSVETLANWLILKAAELCRGDVSNWRNYMASSEKLIKDRGGLLKFNRDKNEHWLVTNFIYHDMLRSSTTEAGTFFPVEEYDAFNMGNELELGLDPLQGLVRPLINMIGLISTVASEVRALLKYSSSIYIPNDKQYALAVIMQKASSLERKIDDIIPDMSQLHHFSQDELELQLTLFELFQYSAKLHLRQSVHRLSPSTLETQYIVNGALRNLSIVLHSSVEGSLCFPLFIVGMNCSTKEDRDVSLDMFDDIIRRCFFKQLVRTRSIVKRVWELDPDGTKCIDWYAIMKDLEWDVCFA